MADEATESCVARACQGNAEAFSELIARCERMVLAVAYAVLGDRDLASDVAQETFLRGWQRLHELKRPEAFEGWICGIARNLAADTRRTRLSLRLIHKSLPPREIVDPEKALHTCERRQRIAEALGQLDELTRTAIVLRYYENLPSKHIGRLLGLSAAAVDMRLSRGRDQLRQRLRSWLQDPANQPSEVAK